MISVCICEDNLYCAALLEFYALRACSARASRDTKLLGLIEQNSDCSTASLTAAWLVFDIRHLM